MNTETQLQKARKSIDDLNVSHADLNKKLEALRPAILKGDSAAIQEAGGLRTWLETVVKAQAEAQQQINALTEQVEAEAAQAERTQKLSALAALAKSSEIELGNYQGIISKAEEVLSKELDKGRAALAVLKENKRQFLALLNEFAPNVHAMNGPHFSQERYEAAEIERDALFKEIEALGIDAKAIRFNWFGGIQSGIDEPGEVIAVGKYGDLVKQAMSRSI